MLENKENNSESKHQVAFDIDALEALLEEKPFPEQLDINDVYAKLVMLYAQFEDEKQAVYYFNKIATEPASILAEGMMTYHGWGRFKKDKKRYLQLFNQAADENHHYALAQFALASYYEAAKDFVKAYEFFDKAIKQDQSLKYTHLSLILHLKKLFPYDKRFSAEGACQGLTSIAHPYFLGAGKIEYFTRMQQELCEIPLEEIHDVMKRDKTRELQTFAEAIVFSQKPNNFPELFPANQPLSQDATLTLPLLWPRIKTEQKDEQHLEKLTSISGCYDIESLENFLTDLKDLHKKYQGKASISLQLANVNHAIAFGFTGDDFLLLDTNQLPMRKITKPNIAAKHIFRGLRGSDIAAFSVTPFVLSADPRVIEQYKADIVKLKREWKDKFLKTAFNKQNRKLKTDANKATLLSLAAKYNDLDMVNSVLEQGAEIDNASIFVASALEHTAIVDRLLSNAGSKMIFFLLINLAAFLFATVAFSQPSLFDNAILSKEITNIVVYAICSLISIMFFPHKDSATTKCLVAIHPVKARILIGFSFLVGITEIALGFISGYKSAYPLILFGAILTFTGAYIAYLYYKRPALNPPTFDLTRKIAGETSQEIRTPDSWRYVVTPQSSKGKKDEEKAEKESVTEHSAMYSASTIPSTSAAFH